MSNNSEINLFHSSSESTRYRTSQSSDLKVIGEVGAGYLKSKAAASYSSLIGTDLNKITEGSKYIEFQHTVQRITELPTITQSASADEVTKHWPAFVSSISKSHIAIGTSLTETQILDVNNGMVVFHVQTITIFRHLNAIEIFYQALFIK